MPPTRRSTRGSVSSGSDPSNTKDNTPSKPRLQPLDTVPESPTSASKSPAVKETTPTTPSVSTRRTRRGTLAASSASQNASPSTKSDSTTATGTDSSTSQVTEQQQQQQQPKQSTPKQPSFPSLPPTFTKLPPLPEFLKDSSSSSEYHTSQLSQKLCQVSIATICSKAGFDKISSDAMHLLNHTLATYIKELVTLAHSYAELSNRTKLNMNDAYLVMDDMALQPMDLIRFAEYLRPISPIKQQIPTPRVQDPTSTTPLLFKPFPQQPPPIPIVPTNTAIKLSEDIIPPSLQSLPTHYPPLPGQHTYKFTPITTLSTEASEESRTRELSALQIRSVETSLEKLIRSSGKSSTSTSGSASSSAVSTNKSTIATVSSSTKPVEKQETQLGATAMDVDSAPPTFRLPIIRIVTKPDKEKAAKSRLMKLDLDMDFDDGFVNFEAKKVEHLLAKQSTVS